ncbi:hypothetical protein FNU79_12280 [Deinococcus detaillensis]|uniref:Uncharacterized protein n=1 Tax=Deinococcus detaillensis TaxID=2592048 RepID=A0A553USB3_9DEIO|nr:hypothetical protein [Deinococcus detaillensis]TSA83107.1 hypothetical protein FNU79_12280 [Deinococcus detaillensis]
MRLLREAHEFEYRDAAGIDRSGRADIWEVSSGERAVLVLRGLDGRGAGGERLNLLEQAGQARSYLSHSWLPFLVPHAQLDVLILHPGLNGKPRALSLPSGA